MIFNSVGILDSYDVNIKPKGNGVLDIHEDALVITNL
jgi:hypothetical protein